MTSTELSAILMDEQVERQLRYFWEYISRSVPELGAMAMKDGRGRHKDTVEHTIMVTAKTPARLRVRLCALFHDVGKPDTRKIEDDGTVSFHGHEQLGAKMTTRILKELGYDKELASQVGRLVGLSGATKGSQGWGEAAIRRFDKEAGELLEDLLDFVVEDVTSRHQVNHDRVKTEIATLWRRIREVRAADEAAKWRPVVSGDEIMERYGLRPGKQVGEAIKTVSAAQKAAEEIGGTFTKDDAWAILDSGFTK